MADISKIKVGSTNYDLVDAISGYSSLEVTNTLDPTSTILGTITVDGTTHTIYAPDTTTNYGLKARVDGIDLRFINDWDGSEPEILTLLSVSNQDWEPAAEAGGTLSSAEAAVFHGMTEADRIIVSMRQSHPQGEWEEKSYSNLSIIENIGLKTIGFDLDDPDFSFPTNYVENHSSFNFYYDEGLGNDVDWLIAGNSPYSVDILVKVVKYS